MSSNEGTWGLAGFSRLTHAHNQGRRTQAHTQGHTQPTRTHAHRLTKARTHGDRRRHTLPNHTCTHARTCAHTMRRTRRDIRRDRLPLAPRVRRVPSRAAATAAAAVRGVGLVAVPRGAARPRRGDTLRFSRGEVLWASAWVRPWASASSCSIAIWAVTCRG
jgi:hypothetical protein